MISIISVAGEVFDEKPSRDARKELSTAFRKLTDAKRELNKFCILHVWMLL